MSAQDSTQHLTLEPNEPRRLASLCGPLDQHLRQIEQRLAIEIHNRGNRFQLHGTAESTGIAGRTLDELYALTSDGTDLTPEQVHLALQAAGASGATARSDSPEESGNVLQLPRCLVKPRSQNQQRYVNRIFSHDINFGIGPAGTGKTWLAVACAVATLERERVNRIVLVRPAVEAGEKLGFLPGDLSQKINPYLRPLYDALYTMMGFEQVTRLIDRSVIEVAPLAYMRGRTLDNAFIILDEGQNSTREQMKMFLTRIGFGSIAVVTGDITQIDLPGSSHSGLIHAQDVLAGTKGISFTRFDSSDVVRHPLVQQIIDAYSLHEQRAARPNGQDAD